MQARKKLCDVYGKDCLIDCQFHYQFAHFHSGNFNVLDAPYAGRPTTTDDDKIKASIESNRRLTTWKIAEKLGISNSIVYLQQLSYINKLDVRVPHELKEIHFTKRINNNPFLKRIITSDEK